jgi:hypothetical protein
MFRSPSLNIFTYHSLLVLEIKPLLWFNLTDYLLPQCSRKKCGKLNNLFYYWDSWDRLRQSYDASDAYDHRLLCIDTQLNVNCGHRKEGHGLLKISRSDMQYKATLFIMHIMTLFTSTPPSSTIHSFIHSFVHHRSCKNYIPVDVVTVIMFNQFCNTAFA